MVSSAVGSGLCAAGILLTPFTFGASNGLTAIGGPLLAAGTATSVGTWITDEGVLRQIGKTKLKESFQTFQSTMSRSTEELNTTKEIKEILNKSLYVGFI